MGATSIFLNSTRLPSSVFPFQLSSQAQSTNRISHAAPVSSVARVNAATSLGHFSKHLKWPSPIKPTTAKPTRTDLCPALRCSASSSSQPSSQTPLTQSLKIPFLSSFNLSSITPLEVCKWAGVLSLAIAATKKIASVLLNPFFWMYFSWTWLFWPWIFAIALAIYGLYCLRKQSQQKASMAEQLVIVTAAITWLTLVPPAHFNGYLEGWPFVFFFAYHYFFFFESSVRSRLYGDLYPRSHDPKWDIALPFPARVAFAAAIMVGHWFAAAEGPALHLTPGGWANFGVWVLIVAAQFMKYHSTLYLAKGLEKVLVPTAVVQFGPYRWVRHPIYASLMLLFAAYCIALRAPLSLVFIVAACVIYYDQKVKLEEALMLESFGEAYSAYMSKVPYKFIPRLY